MDRTQSSVQDEEDSKPAVRFQARWGVREE